MRFDCLDPDARRVLELAQEEAVRLAHNYIGTEHVLVGLALSDGFAAELLGRLGCTPEVARAGLVDLIGPGDPTDRDSEALLASFGIDLGEVRRRVEDAFGSEAMARAALRVRPRWRWRHRLPWLGCNLRGWRSALLAGRGLGMAPRLKRVLEMATTETAPASTTPTHLLWAMAEEGEGVACQILAGRGIDVAAVAAEARHHLT